MAIKNKKLMKRTFLTGSALAALLSAGILIGCSGDIGIADAQDAGGGAKASREISERGGGEHGGGASGASGSEEASGANLAPNDTFDAVRGGARLILNYDAASNAFIGTVENTTSNVLDQVRIEVHLSNGTELGPTVPVDMAPGETRTVMLPSTAASFTGWIAHAEVGGGGAEGGQSGGESGGGESGGGESGPDGPEGPESGGAGSEAAMEAAMSSPIIPLDQTWNGVLGGLAVSSWYDATTQTVHSTVQNTLPQTQCYVQAEPHLKSGSSTVGELGPDQLGDLNPGQQAISSVSVASEPSLAGVAFDGYVVHLEVFDCGGSGPAPHTGGEGGEGAGGEGHGPGGEGSGSESGGESGGAGSEEGSGANLAPGDTFDAVRGGGRLILNYDAASNSFTGTVVNTTNNVLNQVRVEVHLSNGTELGPTTPVNMAPGAVLGVNLPATGDSFTGWIAHAEVGGGSEGGGEHGGGRGNQSGGEHGGSGESGGEHGGRGERRGGG